jgi:hypothetical protein
MPESKEHHRLDDIESLEADLAGTLRPISPPQGYAQRLRERIRFPDREVLVRRLRDWRRLFITFGGVMTGILLIITVGRALYYLAGRKNLA